MARKRHTAEEIVAKLRQVDVLMAQGRLVADAVRSIGVTEVTYYRWRNEYGGLEGWSDEAAPGAGDRELASAAGCIKPDAGQAHLGRGCKGKLLSPSRRHACVDHVTTKFGVFERRACRALGQHRSTQLKIPTTPDDKAALTADIIALVRQYGRYGYRRITAMLRSAGWMVNKKRVERIWRCEGLKVPAKQPKRRRLWLNDGSCVHLRPQRPNHVWSYDFIADRTWSTFGARCHSTCDALTMEMVCVQ